MMERKTMLLKENEIIEYALKDWVPLKVGYFYTDFTVPEFYKKNIQLTKTYKIDESYFVDKSVFKQIERDNLSIAGEGLNKFTIINYHGAVESAIENRAVVKLSVSVYEDTRVSDEDLVIAKEIYDKELFRAMSRPDSFSETLFGRSTDDESIAFNYTMEFFLNNKIESNQEKNKKQLLG